MTRPAQRHVVVHLLQHIARPCVPAGVIAGFAAIASWLTVSIAVSAGDAAVVEILGYVTVWFGILSALFLGFALFVTVFAVTEEVAHQIADRRHWRRS